MFGRGARLHAPGVGIFRRGAHGEAARDDALLNDLSAETAGSSSVKEEARRAVWVKARVRQYLHSVNCRVQFVGDDKVIVDRGVAGVHFRCNNFAAY